MKLELDELHKRLEITDLMLQQVSVQQSLT